MVLDYKTNDTIEGGTDMPIQDLARDDVISTTQETSIEDLAQLMRDKNVGSVVITNDTKPIGIVTDRDLTTRVLADGRKADELSASDVMTKDICSVDESAGFYEAAQVMSEHGVRRLPVCNSNGDLSGIITADDLTELIADKEQQLAEIIRSQRPPY